MNYRETDGDKAEQDTSTAHRNISPQATVPLTLLVCLTTKGRVWVTQGIAPEPK